MCGIVGFFGPHGATTKRNLETSSEALSHRGPDNSGLWLNAAAGIFLAHRRLSIIDLSDSGNQPIHSPCGRFSLVFNGEVYNHIDLRRLLELEGGAFNWLGCSDTEVLLAGLRHWGVEECLKRVNGMFALALWDNRDHTLFLARDRLGEKPLYYGVIGDTFAFSSELKALVNLPNWTGEIDRGALELYMRYGYVPAPRSIYKQVRKLLPAHYLVVRDRGHTLTEPRCYWNLSEIAHDAGPKELRESHDLIEELDRLLRDAVRLRMIADVPLGAFLSGGFDSTMVVAQMQAQSSRPIKTFSIGFSEKAYNEAVHAKAVATHIGTDHTQLIVSPTDAMEVIPNLPVIYDEPFADSSQIPTYLVCRLAKNHVKVSLSGDGGDELFCGYNRYMLGFSLWSRLRLLPTSLRIILARVLEKAPANKLEYMQSLLPRSLRVSFLPDRLPKLAEVIRHRDSLSFYQSLVSQWQNPENVVIGSEGGGDPLASLSRSPMLADFRDQMMLFDMLTYLPGDILTKVDRASMSVGLEARVPLLDHRLVEFAWRVPIGYKARNGQSKWILKQVLKRYVPIELMERPKMGFGVPIEHWLRGPLRGWAEDLLSERKLTAGGYFDPLIVRRMWKEHISYRRRWHYQLWNVLMFQAWMQCKKVTSTSVL